MPPDLMSAEEAERLCALSASCGFDQDSLTSRTLRTVVALRAENARLTSEVEEARLELAAERGEQEGASGLTLPWRYVGVVWRVDLRDRRMVLRAQRDGWEILRERGRGWSGACSSIRAAMRAAEAALAEVPRG